MPFDRKKYPPDWEAIRKRILLRVGDRCEGCRVHNYTIGTRTKDGLFQPTGGNWYWDNMEYTRSKAEAREAYRAALETWDNDPDEPKPIQIILTIAHIHNPDPMDCRDENLQALCQRCHNRLDAPMRRANAAATRAKKKQQPALFKP